MHFPTESMLGNIIERIRKLPTDWLGTLSDLIEKLTSESGPTWLTELKRFCRKEPCWVGVVEVAPTCTKLLSGATVITIAATDGKKTLAKADKLFTGYLDDDFKNWGLDVEAPPTKPMNVTVHQLVKDGDFSKIFGGLSDNLDSLCLTQSQIIEFVKEHRKWLRTDGYATLFLFKVEDEFFVAYVHLYSDGTLGAHVYRFGHDYVWIAGHRRHVVVPQLDPVST
ncbi:MAG: hypothetical protein AAB447_00280 [Patescibacteria group bacterium]